MRYSTIVSAASPNPLLALNAALALCIVGGLPASIARAPILLQPNTWSIERRKLSMRCSRMFRRRSLCGQRLGYLDHRSLGRVVTGLFQQQIPSLVNTTCCTGAEHCRHWRFACAHRLRLRSITLRPESWSAGPPQPLTRGSRAVSTAITPAKSLVNWTTAAIDAV